MVVYPHKDLRWLLVVLLLAVAIIAAAIGFGGLSESLRIFAIAFLILALVVLLDTLSLTKLHIIVDEGSISLKNTLTKYSVTIPWNELHYGYYMYSGKGHKYMLLSTQALTQGMQKKYFRKSTMTMAQFLKGNGDKACLCFSVANDLSDQILLYIPPHIVIQ